MSSRPDSVKHGDGRGTQPDDVQAGGTQRAKSDDYKEPERRLEAVVGGQRGGKSVPGSISFCTCQWHT